MCTAGLRCAAGVAARRDARWTPLTPSPSARKHRGRFPPRALLPHRARDAAAPRERTCVQAGARPRRRRDGGLRRDALAHARTSERAGERDRGRAAGAREGASVARCRAGDPRGVAQRWRAAGGSGEAWAPRRPASNLGPARHGRESRPARVPWRHHGRRTPSRARDRAAMFNLNSTGPALAPRLSESSSAAPARAVRPDGPPSSESPRFNRSGRAGDRARNRACHQRGPAPHASPSPSASARARSPGPWPIRRHTTSATPSRPPRPHAAPHPDPTPGP